MQNQLRFVLSLLKARLTKRRVPLSVGIHVTNKCNFKCAYCFGGYFDKVSKEMKTGEILQLIDELQRMGTLWITLTGGEPLLRPDIETIIDEIRQRNIIVSMNTNGSLIGKKIDAVKKVDYITVSLDGEEAANDLNRGRGTFKQIWAGIQCLKANKIPFDAVAVLTKHNVGGIDSLLDLAEKTGFLIEFNFLQDQAATGNDPTLFMLSDQTIRQTLTKLIALKKRGKPIFYAASSRRYALNWPVTYGKKILYESPPGFKPIVCYLGDYMCHIDSDGKVYPCIQLAGTFPALNCLDHGFEAAWDRLRNKSCKSCYAVCYAEFNRIFALMPDVWMNSMKQIILNKLRARKA